jgi:hypothetical protein
MTSAISTATAYREPIPESEEIATFAYGANMSVDSLKNRGIVSVRHARARLANHKLCFNVGAAVRIEGGQSRQ